MKRVAIGLVCVAGLVFSFAGCSKSGGGEGPAPVRTLTDAEKTTMMSVLEGVMASQLGIKHVGKGGTAVLGKPKARTMIDLIKGECQFGIKEVEGDTELLQMAAAGPMCPIVFGVLFRPLPVKGKDSLFGPILHWTFKLKETKDSGFGTKHDVEMRIQHDKAEAVADRGTIPGVRVTSSGTIKSSSGEFSSGAIDYKGKISFYEDQMTRLEAVLTITMDGAIAVVELTEITGGPDGYELKVVANGEVLSQMKAIQLRQRLPNLIMEIKP